LAASGGKKSAKMTLSEKQRKILEYLQREHERTGVYPSIRELAHGVGLRSTNTVHYHLRQLEKLGLLRRSRTARTYELLEGGLAPLGRISRAPRRPAESQARSRAVRIPLLGRVAAGTPILAEQNFEGFVNLTEYFAPSGETFALRVRGDSMIEAGIFDGDVVIVRSQPTVQNGEIAVVVIDGEATVKRLYEEPDAWRLEPANAALQSIRVPKSEPAFRIASKVVGVLRKL